MLPKKVLMLISLFVVLVTVGVFVWKFSKETEIVIDTQTTSNTSDSPFAKKEDPETLLQKTIKQYESIEFDPATQLVSIKVNTYDATQNILYGSVTWPPNTPMKDVSAFMSCDLEDYRLRKLTALNVPPTFEQLSYEEVVKGLTNGTYVSFTGLCNDESCNSFVSNCTLN